MNHFTVLHKHLAPLQYKKASTKNEIKSAISELKKALELLISTAVNEKQNTHYKDQQ